MDPMVQLEPKEGIQMRSIISVTRSLMRLIGKDGFSSLRTAIFSLRSARPVHYLPLLQRVGMITDAVRL